MSPAPELHDIQGLVARGYGNLSSARFLLLGFHEQGAARAWLRELCPQITPATERPDRRAVHIAFTAEGLRKLGVPEIAIRGFSNEFVDGMTTPHRSRILGDIGSNAPENWSWGGPHTADVDALLLLYARDDAELAAAGRDLIEDRTGIDVLSRLETSDLQGREPFGFKDGISQPLIEGLSKKGPPEITLRFGEFVLGYPNEYDRYTDRPLLDRATDRKRLLPVDAGTGRPDLGRNGTYLVMRQLAQDVRGFWRFLDAHSRGPNGEEDAAARVRLGAKMVGRWPSGAPMTLAPEVDNPALQDANDFGYHALDAAGTRCPIGAHVRRANPRDSLDPAPGTPKSYELNRRHRILRRGREYGDPLTIEEALQDRGPDGDDARGLHFICLSGNIARQFEFVNGTWLNDPKFAGLYDDSDPLVGPSEPYGGTFTIPSHPVRARVSGVPRFVAVKGGAYFFLPGLAATRYLAERE